MSPSRSGLISRLVPPLVASLALLMHAGLMYKAVLRHTGGAISYPVDDTFIHLALAKQIALSGVYGVTPHEFAAASSSIGWPLLLAFAIKLLGAKAWLPLLLNAGFAVALLCAVDTAVRRLAPGSSTLARTLVCVAVMVLAPMATLVVLGMEHTAHAAATIAFLAVATSWLSEADDDDGKAGTLRRALPVAAWAASTTLWRYEGMFVVALVVGLAVLRRRVRAAAVVAATGALPIVLFGLYSKARGSHFLPVPVILKGRHFDVTEPGAWGSVLGGDLLDRFTSEGYALGIAVAIVLLAFYLVRRDGFWTTNVLALLLTLGMIVLHLELAAVGWFFRYEAYLLATGVTVIGATLARLLPPPRELWHVVKARKVQSAVAVAGFLLLLAPVLKRADSANASTPLACRNIHDQQMQTARFLAAQFPHQRVAVNDIGAVAWLDNDRVLDLMGLASIAVAEAKKMKLDQPLEPVDVVRLTNGVKVAVVYDEWFPDNLPGSWLRVGRWKIADNKSCAFPSVGIYAAEPEHFPSVIEALRAFAPQLPKGVKTEGRFTDSPSEMDRLRSGDRIVVATSDPKVSGAYAVEADGTIVLYGFGPIRVRGLALDEAPAAMQTLMDALPSKLRNTRVEKVTRVGRRAPVVLVAGAVKTAGEIPMPPTIDAAVTSASPLPSADTAGAWVWRENAGTFAKVAHADLEGGALRDGDIVIVPTTRAP